ncbi:MAG: YggS family pyridoxal phosphate-dependent enzyme [Hyphomicrobium sp.]|uniref:YggS family pyridoxal phosphate-dependent enzyme n=1 Tax=Hyphomicrobium sp. TaxID=82 RepID=UPI0013287C86|nr:YggS family pyridoxal phosphate-dependent enzyme [Hyphomicrobium sp.]KAB2940668.1 MAG: YggS family pyridoxal phosphate-dependent enzyme [Hyphomicrobium sp.]MBZ0211563.1 YggS family pyridoxal phosphate-dependent enzyme [Hyphomicrobium sp.]
MPSHPDLQGAIGSVAASLAAVRARITRAAEQSGRSPDAVRLVLATKTVPPERILEAVEAGQVHLAENRVQEGRAKAVALADRPIRWSMIGHLQTNKVKDALRFVDEVQSLDRLTLAKTLDGYLQRLGRPLDVLVQVNTSGEATKYGLPPHDVLPFLRELRAFASLRIRGFMTLGRFTPDVDEVRRCFRLLRTVRDAAREAMPCGEALQELSMGMSGDFEAAIAEGATIVRVGQAVFGRRPLPDSYFWPTTGTPHR